MTSQNTSGVEFIFRFLQCFLSNHGLWLIFVVCTVFKKFKANVARSYT